jgi:predicted nucleotidyltransferase
MRGVHVLPATESVGLLPKRETIEIEGMRGGVELDLVTHDILKFFSMLLKRNGYVLEQLYSPLIVQGSPAHDELKEIAKSCVTRHHSHHYLGFAATQWSLFQKESPPRVKPLLYVYRGLLTGIHLMRTGRIEANLIMLNEDFRLPYLGELVRRKIQGTERARLETPEIEFHQAEYERLVVQLETEAMGSALPVEATGRDALNDLLVRVRLHP